MTNWKTTLGAIMTVVSLVPAMIEYLALAEVPHWLSATGVVCAALSFLWAGFKAKDGGVTGAGDNARRVK